uniref:Major facilitator superfamily (MFS) profile domain-containing protein n=1 Tax=Heliothis virescens TaxID=7102 RepID=A0A2A4K5J0_HELVI
MIASDLNNVNKKYKNVPPDGGWGYMIAVAVIILSSTSTAFVSSYNMLFKEFLRDIGRSSTDVSLIPSVGVTCIALAGFLTNPLLSLMSHRMLTLVAVLIFNTGVVCILFVKSVFTFHVCYGILQGLGMGFMYNLSCSILNDYFVKRPLMIISLIQSVVAIASIMAPLLVKWSLDRYGFRDTMILLSGLTLHNFIAVTLMHPAKWHMKKVEIDCSNEKFLPEKQQSEDLNAIPIIKLTNADGNILNANDKLYLAENDDTGINFRKILNLLIDKSLYEGFLLSCVCAGPALALFADTTYSSIISQALHTAGWVKKENVALANTLYNIGDLVMRLLFLLLSNWFHKLGSQELYVLGVTLGLVSRLGMLWSKSFIAIMIFISLVGVSHCAVTILVPLVVGDAVPAKKFTSALGMLMMLTGIVNLVLGPAIGAVRDLSESHGPVFYLIASCFAIIENVALANTLYNIGDLVMRLLFLLLSNWFHKLGSQELYVLGVTLGLVSRLGMLWSKSFIAIMIFISLVGVSHCAVTILVPLVVGDAVPAKKFTSALGMLMMLTGIVNLVLGPAIGAVRDLSESHGPVFYLIASCFAIIVLFWSIEMCYKKNKHKRLQRREYLRQKKLNK